MGVHVIKRNKDKKVKEMSKISKVIARFKSIKLGENSIEFRIKPMKNKEMLEMFEMLDDKNEVGSMRKGINHLIFTTLKKDDPSITIDEVDDIDFKSVTEIVNNTTELSGLGKLIDFSKIMNMDELEKKRNLKKTSEEPSNAESLRQELIKEETSSQ